MDLKPPPPVLETQPVRVSRARRWLRRFDAKFVLIVLIPTLILIASIIAVIGAFYALQIHPLLGLLVVASCAGILISVALWERNRVARQLMGPQDEDN